MCGSVQGLESCKCYEVRGLGGSLLGYSDIDAIQSSLNVQIFIGQVG